MADPSPPEQSKSFNTRVPFSERPLAPASTPEPPALPQAPQQHHIEADLGPVVARTEPATAPLFLPPSAVPGRAFRILSPEELTAEEHRSVELQMTAYYNVQQMLSEAARVPEPEPYEERFFIWKMIFKMMVPVLVLIASSVAIVGISMLTQASGWSVVGWVLAFIGVALVNAWFAARIYYDWSHTIIFSNRDETGTRRQRNRWLLLTEVNQTMGTSSLLKKDATRGWFTSLFSINSWRINFDSAVTDDDFLKDRGFVRDGDRLKKTVLMFQQYR